MKPATRRPVEFLNMLKAQKDDYILDIGAGTGRIAKYYSYVNNLVLLDPAEKMLNKAIKVIPHAKAIIGTIENHNFRPNSFNKIVCYDSFHHWQNQLQGLKETFYILKPKGKFVICEVDPSNFWGHKVQLFERMIMKMNSIMYTPDKLIAILKFVGFKRIKYDQMDNGLAYCLECTKKG
ncbi:MAG: class I SAM-dependent methyltransferase [Candidatus Hodarchaeales archaeon]|jgi:ubiquinone/menaquinone biosynthesis C-methylase UbiE